MRLMKISSPFLGIWLAFGETNAFDKAARLLGLGVGGGEIVPEGFAVVGVAQVGQLVGDDVIDHPARPAAHLIADADVAVGNAAAGAAAQSMLHVADPTDGLPFKLIPEMGFIDGLGARLQVGIGTAFSSLGLAGELFDNII